MRLFSAFLGFICLTSCSSESNQNLETPVPTPILTEDSSSLNSSDELENHLYTFEVVETPGLGWGYKIFDNGTLFINQPHIPAIQGNKGFTTKEKAEITAQFAILKMEQGFVPPTISPDELDSLGVLN
jgi:hypothetical protein